MKVYVPLEETTDYINKEGNTVINQTAETYVSESEGAAHFENDETEYYPDLVVTKAGWTAAPTFMINGQQIQSVELIGGAHPPQRPR